MITITYSYKCDCCGKAIRPDNTYNYTGTFPDAPAKVDTLGTLSACKECVTAFGVWADARKVPAPAV